MEEIVSFSAAAKRRLYARCEALCRCDADEANEGQLPSLLTQAQESLRQLDGIEPPDMGSDAYELWAQVHEQVEDLRDALLDRLDELT